MSDASTSTLFGELRERSAEEERVTISDLLEVASGRALGPFLLLPGLLMISPISGIPGVPTILACFVFLVSLQLLMGAQKIWLPKKILSLGVKSEKAEKVLKKVQPKAESLEKVFKPRLTSLVSRPMRRMAGVIAVLIAISVPPLEFVPFAAFVPGLALFLMGLAITTHDGLLMMLSLLTVLCGIGAGVWLAVS